MAIAGLVGGASVGSLGVFLTRGATTEAAEGFEPPFDANLAWVYSLCRDESPVSELIRRRASLYIELISRPKDEVLWHGVDRLARHAMAGGDPAESRALAGELARFITHLEPSTRLLPGGHLEALNGIARGR